MKHSRRISSAADGGRFGQESWWTTCEVLRLCIGEICGILSSRIFEELFLELAIRLLDASTTLGINSKLIISK